MTDNKHKENCNCGHDHDHNHDDCCCGHEEMDMMTLTLDDGSVLECQVLGVFEVENKEYIALLPVDEDTVLLYEYNETDEGIELENIDSEKEYDLVVEAFYELISDEEDIEIYEDEE